MCAGGPKIEIEKGETLLSEEKFVRCTCGMEWKGDMCYSMTFIVARSAGLPYSLWLFR